MPSMTVSLCHPLPVAVRRLPHGTSNFPFTQAKSVNLRLTCSFLSRAVDQQTHSFFLKYALSPSIAFLSAVFPSVCQLPKPPPSASWLVHQPLCSYPKPQGLPFPIPHSKQSGPIGTPIAPLHRPHPLGMKTRPQSCHRVPRKLSVLSSFSWAPPSLLAGSTHRDCFLLLRQWTWHTPRGLCATLHLKQLFSTYGS